MKQFILLKLFLLGLGSLLVAQNDINFIRIGETNPSTAAYVFGTGEQLSGQQFQTDGIVTYKGYQYTVYYNQTRNVCIARRRLPIGNWEEIALPYQNAVDDAHNTISMGICHTDGSIHLSYDHHNDNLHYCYSIVGSANDPENMPWEAASFSPTTDVMDKAVPDVTYPRFITKPDGNLLFECRFRWSGYGDSYLREYDGNTKQWTLIGRYVQGEDVNPDACAYINGMTYDYPGRLHVTWCWRDDFGGGSNHDFYYAYSEDDGRTWKDTFGEQNAVTEYMDPVYSNTTGTCLGQTKKTFMIEEIPYNKGYINQETQAVDSKGRIHAVNSQIPGTETDSNWASSRLKARLHHRFRDADGTWKTILVKKNGENVHSYCRTNLSFDAFDNAFVIANGAEVYCATDAMGYEDWNLMSDVDNGRFLSEPLVDRNLLRSEGILSFVYLGADNKITVIDYLLDNPDTPSGNGLSVEYFADDTFSSSIGSEKEATLATSSFPANTKSVRWTGAFETSYAQEYTLYLTTSAEAVVYVDGVKVLLTRRSEEAKEYSFTFAPIASHKHNIVIEAKAIQADAANFKLSWSASGVVKGQIPVNALYPEVAHEIDLGGSENAPELPRKSDLENQLLGMTHIGSQTTVDIPAFNPVGDYTIEVKAQIISSDDCGLVFEGRAANGKGFRISLGETNLNWLVPYSSPSLLTVADNNEEQTYRLAIEGEKVHIYQGEEYIASTDLSQIGDVEGAEEVMPDPQVTDLNLSWAGPDNRGSGYPDEYGWENTVAGIGWNVANGGSGVRFLDVDASSDPNHTYNGTVYEGRILTIRWDGSYGSYSFPIELEANVSYEFSMLYEWWNNGSPTSISVGVSTEKTGANLLGVKSFSTSSKNVLQKATFSFTSQEAGTYYLIFNGQSGVMYGIADLELNKLTYTSKLTLSRYCSGNADINITGITYEDGAYAPGQEQLDVELEIRETLADELAKDIQIIGLDGSKNIQRYSFDHSGDYSVEIAATVSSAEGRGLDLEVRDEEGIGFRTALNHTEFSWISPFIQAQTLNASDREEQVIRYAVKDNKVYVFHNGEYIQSFTKQAVGNMDEEGTTEGSAYSNTAVTHEANLVDNPDFQTTADNGAPEGWTSNGVLGASPNARVQLKSSTTELSAYPDGTKAFQIRFDGSYTWFSYGVTLEADTWYEYAFDLIAWGDANVAKTFNLVVSTSEAGEGTVVLSQQLTTPSVRATADRKVIRFKTDAAGKYYITYAKNGTLAGTAGVTNLCLVDYSLSGILVGKNYVQGAAEIGIRYITIDREGAFAPLKDNPVSLDPIAEAKDGIRFSTYGNVLEISCLQNMNRVALYDLSGRCVLAENNCGQTITTQLAKGIYIVDITTEKQERIRKKVLIP